MVRVRTCATLLMALGEMEASELRCPAEEIAASKERPNWKTDSPQALTAILPSSAPYVQNLVSWLFVMWFSGGVEFWSVLCGVFAVRRCGAARRPDSEGRLWKPIVSAA